MVPSVRMLYLVRHAEIGRDAQSTRRGQREDLRSAILRADPEARIEESTGRLLVESAHDLRAALASIHGVGTFSPCRRVPVEALDEAMRALAREALSPGRSFVVRVRRPRGEGEPSMALAARLGGVVLSEVPGTRVELHAPDVVLGVELRDGRALLFHETFEGVDRQEGALPATQAELRFLADQMVIRLGSWLRLLGYDTRHAWGQPDTWLLRTAREEGRVILTRDRGLAAAKSARIHFVKAEDTGDQLVEVVRAFHLPFDPERVFTRCSRCNGRLVRKPPSEVGESLPDDVREGHAEVRVCEGCGRVYWLGSHAERIVERLKQVCGDTAGSRP